MYQGKEIREHMQLLSNEALSEIARGMWDMQKVARDTLKGRYCDENGKWVGPKQGGER